MWSSFSIPVQLTRVRNEGGAGWTRKALPVHTQEDNILSTFMEVINCTVPYSFTGFQTFTSYQAGTFPKPPLELQKFYEFTAIAIT